MARGAFIDVSACVLLLVIRRFHPPMADHPVFSLFNDATSWQVCASGQARAELSAITGDDGGAGLRLEYDFHGGGGFIVIRRVCPFNLPTTFQMGFRLRGNG